MGLRDKLVLTDSHSGSSGGYAQSFGYGQPQQFQSRHASLSMHEFDTLRLLNFSPAVIDMCRQAIAAIWTRGIKKEKDYAGSYEFSMQGSPWQGMGGHTIEARKLLVGLFSAIHQQGWVPLTSTDISRKLYDKDTIIFRRLNQPPPPSDWCCIGFSEYDKLRFIHTPPSVSNQMIDRIGPQWVKRQGFIENDVFEVKLDGSPWHADGQTTMRVRELLLTMFDVLEADGWTFAASVNHKNAGQNYTETDSWFCYRPRGWGRNSPQPGAGYNG